MDQIQQNMYSIETRQKLIKEYAKHHKLSKAIENTDANINCETARRWIVSFKKHGKIKFIYKKRITRELNEQDKQLIKSLYITYKDVHVVRDKIMVNCKIKQIKDILRSQGFVIKNKTSQKYTNSFKERLIQEYISSNIVCSCLSKKYNISNQLLRT